MRGEAREAPVIPRRGTSGSSHAPRRDPRRFKFQLHVHRAMYVYVCALCSRDKNRKESGRARKRVGGGGAAVEGEGKEEEVGVLIIKYLCRGRNCKLLARARARESHAPRTFGVCELCEGERARDLVVGRAAICEMVKSAKENSIILSRGAIESSRCRGRA